MRRDQHPLPNGQTLWVIDSITQLEAAAVGCVVVSGSHGGMSSSQVALAYRPLLTVFNDAGVGKDEAGIRGLALLGDEGLACAMVDYRSARIGDAQDTYENGRVSFVNAPAQALGVRVGMAVKDACALTA